MTSADVSGDVTLKGNAGGVLRELHVYGGPAGEQEGHAHPGAGPRQPPHRLPGLLSFH